MKKFITGAFTLLLFVGIAQAQTKDSTKRGNHKKEWAQKLNITEEQQAQLKTIRESQQKEFKALKEQKLEADAFKAQKMQLRKKYADQTKSVFTPAQQEQMNKMRAERKAQAKGNRKDFRKGKAGKHHKNFGKRGQISNDLNFTEAQKAEMKKLREESRIQAKAIREDKSLSEEQKKEKIKESMQLRKDKMKSILTPEQVEKMQSFKKDRKSSRK